MIPRRSVPSHATMAHNTKTVTAVIGIATL